MQISKGRKVTVDDLEDEIASLCRLMHLGEESDEEDEEMEEHALAVHNSGKGKGKFQGECYHGVKKVHR